MKFKFYQKEFDSEELDYIRYRSEGYMLDQNSFFVSSINGKEEVIEQSRTKNELEIYNDFIVLKKISKHINMLPAKNFEGYALINLKKAENVEIKQTKFLKRKYLEISFKGSFVDSGKIFTTKPVSKNKDQKLENIKIEFDKIKEQRDLIQKEQEQVYLKQRKESYEQMIKRFKLDEKTRQGMEDYNNLIEEEMEK